MISVVIPVYNAQRFLSRCVDSVLAQKTDFECILVDDGSTDDSLRLCREYEKKDSRVRVLHQENRGVSVARNAGLAAAKGEYIVFLDSDDYLLSGALPIALTVQQQFSGDWVLWCYDTGENQPGEGVERYPAQALGQLYIDCLIAMPWNKLYRADLARKLSFDTGLSLGEDLKFCLEYHLAAGCPDFVVVRTPLTYYDCSRDGETLSTRYNPDYCDLWLALFTQLRRQCADLGTSQDTLAVLEQMELRMVAEGVEDILARDPADSDERRAKAVGVLADQRLRELVGQMRREKVYSPYYWAVTLRRLSLLQRMVQWKKSGSPLFGKLDWLGYYLLGGSWKR